MAAQRFHRLLVRHFGPRLKEARLFGSFARGEANEDSDVDVLVLVEQLTRDDKIAAITLASEILLSDGVSIQCLAMGPAEFERLLALETGFARDIMSEGVRL